MNPPRVVITVEAVKNGFIVRRLYQNMILRAPFLFEICSVFREDEFMDLNGHVGEVLSEFSDFLSGKRKGDDETDRG